MSQHEWRKFISDIRVSGRGLSHKFLDRIFVLINRDNEEFHEDQEDNDAEVQNLILFAFFVTGT